MRRRYFLFGGFAAAAAASAGGAYVWWKTTPPPQVPIAVSPPPVMSEREFLAVLAAVRPARGEDVFADIPWHTSLWEARQQAASDGKPILLWEMDGHPLGCG
ncbi:hypothetical protein [Limnoglobus roseus]|uniref:Uncharacterized protein n=1 Tax=Limnoglobus roseus TaxID=2598579 RepID=A0A5C1ADF1_9BACT|nr:hypothetical protein [Limnoglobus roseus]QEL16187.1 hypothetical protein PX52LOC_03127 [Limnoglobus roseus]